MSGKECITVWAMIMDSVCQYETMATKPQDKEPSMGHPHTPPRLFLRVSRENHELNSFMTTKTNWDGHMGANECEKGKCQSREDTYEKRVVCKAR